MQSHIQIYCSVTRIACSGYPGGAVAKRDTQVIARNKTGKEKPCDPTDSGYISRKRIRNA